MGQIATLLNFHGEIPEKGSFSISELDPGVQQHLKVLRLRSGEAVRFINGRGLSVEARCLQIRPLLFEVTAAKRSEALRPQIDLCLAAPKGDLLWEAITQATEVGATSLRLMRSAYTQLTKQQEAPLRRAQKVSDAACEQCLRPWRVAVDERWWSLGEALELPGTKIFADEALSDSGLYGFADSKKIVNGGDRIVLFIGPEGGWSPEERQVLGARAHAMGLGPLILRVPTACATAIHAIKSLFAAAQAR